MAGTVDFEKDVLAHSREQPVLVDFWASWCGPCRVLGPVLERLEARSKGRFKLVKIDTEQQPELASQYGVYSIPAVKLFSDGAEIGEFVGALPEPAVARWLEEHLPTPSRETTAEGERALAAGDLEKGRRLLTQAVELDPQNYAARIALARTYLPEEASTALALVEPVPEGFEGALADAIRTLARLPGLVAAGIPNDGDAKLWGKYLEGIRAFTKRDYGTALQSWIDVIRRSREVDDDGPRRATVALFQHLGEEHELTLTFRRKLASVLY